jgi:hypothetical protein
MAQVNEERPTLTLRSNARLAAIHRNAAALLKRIHDSRGNVSPRDCAMAGIMAKALDNRKPS